MFMYERTEAVDGVFITATGLIESFGGSNAFVIARSSPHAVNAAIAAMTAISLADERKRRAPAETLEPDNFMVTATSILP